MKYAQPPFGRPGGQRLTSPVVDPFSQAIAQIRKIAAKGLEDQGMMSEKEYMILLSIKRLTEE